MASWKFVFKKIWKNFSKKVCKHTLNKNKDFFNEKLKNKWITNNFFFKKKKPKKLQRNASSPVYSGPFRLSRSLWPAFKEDLLISNSVLFLFFTVDKDYYLVEDSKICLKMSIAVYIKSSDVVKTTKAETQTKTKIFHKGRDHDFQIEVRIFKNIINKEILHC